jgi:hypothetical protein
LRNALRIDRAEAVARSLQTAVLLLASSLSVFGIVQAAFLPVPYCLLLESFQDPSLFEGQHAPDSNFGYDSHAHRRCLGSCEIAQPLFDYSLNRLVRIQRFVQSFIRFPQTFIDPGSLVSVLFSDRAYLLPLLWCQVELTDRIAATTGLRLRCLLLGWWAGLPGRSRNCGKANERCQQR